MEKTAMKPPWKTPAAFPTFPQLLLRLIKKGAQANHKASYDPVRGLWGQVNGVHHYAYDAENRMTSVDSGATASYVYGPDGQRVKTQAYEYLYDLDGNTIAMLNASTGANIYDEIYAGGRHLATYSSSTTSFNHNDWLGTERVRTGSTGAVAETCTNLPFGDGQTCTGPESSRLHFTGDERDSETGLDHTLFRQYQSLEARWLSVDPLGGDISNPQSLNRYAYVLNDPVNAIDPLGLDCIYTQVVSRKL